MVKELVKIGYKYEEAEYAVIYCGIDWEKENLRFEKLSTKEKFEELGYNDEMVSWFLKYVGDSEHSLQEAKYARDNGYLGRSNMEQVGRYYIDDDVARYSIDSLGIDWIKYDSEYLKEYKSIKKLGKNNIMNFLEKLGYTTEEIKYCLKKLNI